jgi:hypothetical protein
MKEARRYDELTLCLKGKVISSLELQPRFLLQDDYKYKSSKIQPIYYVSDFLYKDLERKVWVVEDTKGMKTEIYKLKKKIFIYHHLDPSADKLYFQHYDKYYNEEFIFIDLT